MPFAFFHLTNVGTTVVVRLDDYRVEIDYLTISTY